jgi:hypothetical protein
LNARLLEADRRPHSLKRRPARADAVSVRTSAEVAVAALIILIIVGVIMGALRVTRRLAGLTEPSDTTREPSREEREFDEFLTSPQGVARLRYEQGASIFQINLPLSETGDDAFLGAVESEGWRLEQADYLLDERRGSVRRTRREATSRIVGIYLFRRGEPLAREEPAVVEHDQPVHVPAPVVAHVPISPLAFELPPLSPS